MATGKNLRTPIIKPRTQGGTFYTFPSAMEDIGLNINDGTNIVKLSHYILLDIPTFGKDSGVLQLGTHGTYNDASVNVGDYTFAEFMQDAVFNMETAVRNDVGYNFSSNKTISERVFWKEIFKGKDSSTFNTTVDGYYYEDASTAVAKGFGLIASGSQRSDSYGIYNETFVQIPSSYGQMRVYYKPVNDENYAVGKTYDASNGNKIVGIQSSELDGDNVKSTGISALSICDNNTAHTYTSSENKDIFEAIIDIDTLRQIYGDSTTYDDIGFGNVPGGDSMPISFNFNAILVYYSIYDSAGKNILATNAYGVYILNNSIASSASGIFYFPELTKSKTTLAASGTSFSFRINVKPTSAYSGDITVVDNSTSAFAESEDFNDVIRNLSDAVQILKRNASTLYTISESNQKIQNFAAEAMTKINDFEKTINSLKLGAYYTTPHVESVFQKRIDNLPLIDDLYAGEVLKYFLARYDDTSGEVSLIDAKERSTDPGVIKRIDGLTSKIDDTTYYDLSKLVTYLVTSYKMLDGRIKLLENR